MNKGLIWISSLRLRTLPLSLSGIILASSFANYNGVFKLNIFIFAILTTLSFQILSNLANDYGDGLKGTDNKHRVGPQRAIQSGRISPKEMLNAIKLNVLLSIFLSACLIYCAFGFKNVALTIIFFVLSAFSIIAAIRYTIGDKAYGYHALGDIFVFTFFGLVSLIGCYVLYAKRIDFIVVLPAMAIGLLSTAVLNLNNMRDIINDKNSNKITLAVKLGSKNAKTYHNILIIGAIITSLVSGLLFYTSTYNLFFTIAYIPLIGHLLRVNKISNPKHFDSELKKLALITVSFSILMGIGYLL